MYFIELKKQLNRKIYLFHNARSKWISIFHSIWFVVLFIFIYEPFGISKDVFVLENSNDSVHEILLYEISAILICQFVFKFIFFRKYYLKLNTIKFYLSVFLLEMVSISLLYNCIQLLVVYCFYDNANILIIESFETGTVLDGHYFLILVIDALLWTPAHVFVLGYPFLWATISTRITELKEEVSELETELKEFKADFIEKETSEITLDLLDENNNIEFTLELSKLLAIESSNQYVLVYYLKDDQVCKQIIRTRLKKFLLELEAYPIYQTHRSYAVNLLNVEQIKSIDKKRVLTFLDSTHLNIPVSKTYLETIKTVISH